MSRWYKAHKASRGKARSGNERHWITPWHHQLQVTWQATCLNQVEPSDVLPIIWHNLSALIRAPCLKSVCICFSWSYFWSGVARAGSVTVSGPLYSYCSPVHEYKLSSSHITQHQRRGMKTYPHMPRQISRTAGAKIQFVWRSSLHFLKFWFLAQTCPVLCVADQFYLYTDWMSLIEEIQCSLKDVL